MLRYYTQDKDEKAHAAFDEMFKASYAPWMVQPRGCFSVWEGGWEHPLGRQSSHETLYIVTVVGCAAWTVVGWGPLLMSPATAVKVQLERERL